MSLQVARAANQRSVNGTISYLVADAWDDASSLSAKLADLGSRRVVLVIPKENRALESPVALRVMSRAADRESIRFVLVSSHWRLRRIAATEGIIAVASVADAPAPGQDVSNEQPLPTPFQSALTDLTTALGRGSSWAVALGLVLGILALVALLLPRATVYVRPVTDNLNGSVKITASIDSADADTTVGILPSRVVYLVVNSSGTVPVNATSHPMDGRAVGFISLENRTNQRVTVPKGTDLSTFSGIHFETTQTTILDDHPGASAQVPIVAIGPGSYGNVLRGQIVVIGGPLRWLITAVNDDKTAGGGPPDQPTVTAWETSRLLDQVMARSQDAARQKIASVLSPNEVAIPESIEVTPIDETFDHAIGDSAPSVSVRVQSRVHTLIVNQHDLDELAMQMWHPALRPGFVPVPNSIQVGQASVVDVSPTSATLTVPLHALAAADVNADRVSSYVRLRSPRDAERDLAKLFDFAAPPTVSISPSWFPRAYRVQVVVQTEPTPGPATSARSER